jgi:hypothetical protein
MKLSDGDLCLVMKRLVKELEEGDEHPLDSSDLQYDLLGMVPDGWTPGDLYRYLAGEGLITMPSGGVPEMGNYDLLPDPPGVASITEEGKRYAAECSEQ